MSSIRRIRVENLGSGHVWIPSLKLSPNATNAQVVAAIEQELGCVSCFLPGGEGIGKRIDFESKTMFPEDCAVVDVLKICPECTIGYPNYRDVARPGHLERLRYMFSHTHANRDDEVLALHVAGHGNLAGLEYLFDNGCPFNETTTESATNHLECLRFLHEHGCPFHKSVCHWAAYHGNLDCLRYAHEHEAPWGQPTTVWAAEFNHVDCLAYALQHGCPHYQ